MANFVASVSPSAPIIAIYIHEIVRTLALPHGAAETAPILVGRVTPCAPLFSISPDGADGYVIIRHERSAWCASALARRSATSMLPFVSHATLTTFMPAMTALAGFVPCAEVGIKQTLRCASPRDS